MNLKLKKKALRRLLLITCLVFSWPTFARVPVEQQQAIPVANFCQRLLGQASNVWSAIQDPLAFYVFNKLETSERDYVKKMQAKASASESDFHTVEDFLATQEPHWPTVTAKDWIPGELGFPMLGSPFRANGGKGSIADLENYLKKEVPAPYSDIALKSRYALTDLFQILNWLKGINAEVLQEMWTDGFRKKEHIYDHRLREYYLDRVLARHAHAKGFKIKSDGLPYGIKTYNPYTFNTGLAAGHFFIDWSGTDLNLDGPSDYRKHYARGHTIVLAYLADHVENLVSLSQFIGRTNDSLGIWSLLFDNALSTKTPFWGGFWVYHFSRYLSIKN